MNAWTCRVLQSFPVTLNVRTAGAGQSGDNRTPHHRGDRFHRLEVSIRSDGKTGLDHIHAQTVELMSQAQLFLLIHTATRRLLSVPKSRVENRDADALCSHGFPLTNWPLII